jgi:hypothetical protein
VEEDRRYSIEAAIVRIIKVIQLASFDFASYLLSWMK